MKRAQLLIAVFASGCALASTSAPDPERPEMPCNSSEATPIMDAAWAITWGLIAVVAINEAVQPYPDDEAKGFALGGGVLAGVHTLSAIKGWKNITACRKRDEEIAAAAAQAPLPALAPSRRGEAWEATKRAKDAARAGDCATVSTLGEVIFNMDPEFHMTVFVRDAAIKQCLTPTQPLPESSAPSQPPPPPTTQPPPPKPATPQPPPLRPARP